MSNIIRIDYLDKEIILVATAHVSKQSVIEVQEIIASEKPDTICVELDKERYDSIKNPKKWEDTDLIKIIKEQRTGLLLINLILAAQQRKAAEHLDSKPGAEFLEAIKIAEANNIKVVLADRNVNTTFTRIYRSLSFMEKIKVLTSIIFSTTQKEKTSEEDIKEMIQEASLEGFVEEIKEEFPNLKKVLVDERDQYLCAKIQNAPGKKIVAVLGAAHTIGIKELINTPQSIKGLDTLPPKKSTATIIGFIIPAIILLAIIISFTQSTSLGYTQIVSWILWNGSFAALGALLVLAHPITIITAFIAAPITSLIPIIGVGFITGIVEASLRKPTAKDAQNLPNDINTFTGFFKNRITKILIVVIVPSLFSAIATFISGTNIISNLFSFLN
ncbi:MAG: TraB/GumN family protein [Erysipelotrichaceae bacterium]